jgi:hypothetical protein
MQLVARRAIHIASVESAKRVQLLPMRFAAVVFNASDPPTSPITNTTANT